MSELSVTTRFSEISLAERGKDALGGMQLERSSVRPLEPSSVVEQQRVSDDDDAFADGCCNSNKPGATEDDELPVLAWYPATEFLELERYESYSFAIIAVSVDAVTTDGQKFTQIVDTLTGQLEQHMAKARLLISINEKIPQFGAEVEELLRVAIGRTQLLLDKRIKQFREQLGRHLNPIPCQKVTKLNDLHGLWALIDMQLDDIRTCFDEIEQYRLHSWRRSWAAAIEPTDELADKGPSANL